ncbi:PaaI family thioesterase [Streptomyces sp. Qhu-G9]|uniref:PaaI family thioesterase n=1 Tax=Streptomyces sp. Qhu-G9 TaxID=3452799 RepID=UPI003AF49162
MRNPDVKDAGPKDLEAKGSPGLAAAREALAAQPFSSLLGARLVAFGEGEAVLELDIRDDLRQQNGFVHGGVLGYAADNALTFAAGTVAGPRLLTSGFTIDYLRPADGTLLRAHARVVRAGRTRVVCRCDLSTTDAEGARTLCAVAQGTIAVAAPR